jgi:hypothetical protein
MKPLKSKNAKKLIRFTYLPKNLVHLQSNFFPANFFLCILEKGIFAGKKFTMQKSEFTLQRRLKKNLITGAVEGASIIRSSSYSNTQVPRERAQNTYEFRGRRVSDLL